MEHKQRSAMAGMWDQKSPIMKTSCVALKRNCLTLGRNRGLFMLIHIVVSVSSLPVKHLMAALAHSMFSVVDWRIRMGFLLRKPLYASAWVSDDIFAPWTLKLSGIFRSRSAGVRLAAPSFASRSHCSLPFTPSWPLTYWKVIMGGRRWFLLLYSWGWWTGFQAPGV